MTLVMKIHTDHEVHIALPVATVHRAWNRYVGYGKSTSGDGEATWRAGDGSGLTASFASDGDNETTLVARRTMGSRGISRNAEFGLGVFVEGFVEYLHAAYTDLSTGPGGNES